jgi:hypothetical protein
MITLNEAIKVWLDEWNLCEICDYYHYRQMACNCQERNKNGQQIKSFKTN